MLLVYRFRGMFSYLICVLLWRVLDSMIPLYCLFCASWRLEISFKKKLLATTQPPPTEEQRDATPTLLHIAFRVRPAVKP